MVESINCPACGTKLSLDVVRCPRCGERLDDVVPPAAELGLSPAGAADGGPAFSYVWVFAVTVAAGSALFLFQGGSEEPAARVLAPVRTPAVAVRERAAPAEPAVSAPVSAPDLPPFIEADRAGSFAYAAGDYEAALGHYQAAIEADPSDAESHSNLGQVLVRAEREADALPYFEQAIALDPKRWAYRFNLAFAHGRMGNWARAVVDYRVASDLFPNDYVTLYNLGSALYKQGNEEAAIVEYGRAIALSPNEPTFQFALGISYERLARRQEAATAYGRYLDLAPQAPNATEVAAKILALTTDTMSGGAMMAPVRPSGA